MSVEDLLSVRSKSPIPILTNELNDSMIREYNRKRGTIKGRLTIFAKYVNSLESAQLTERQLTELKLRHDLASTFITEFNNVQSQIEELVHESDYSVQLDYRETFENSYFNVMANASRLLNVREKSRASNELNCKSHPVIKLPTISLPTFDGSYDGWLEFRDTYTSMIHNSTQLDDIQKFHYLRAALTGNAMQVVKSLEFSSENYAIAWDLLNNRYNNSKLLIHNHVKALFSMQALNKESPSQIRKLIDSVLKNLRALKSLGEPTESWDTLIIYIIVTKLDAVVEKEWEQSKSNSVGNSKQIVNLNALIEFLKEKANILEMIKANHSISSNKLLVDHTKKPPQKVHSFISTQNKKFQKLTRNCIMCNENHSLHACNQFLKLSLNERMQFVDAKTLCNNCLRQGHLTKDCYFGPCKQCNKKHNSLLHGECKKDSTSISAAAHHITSQTAVPFDCSTILHTTTQTHVNSKCSENALNSQKSGLVLLSTAIIEVAGNDNRYYKARALLDSGSQHCLITNSLCNKLNAKRIQSTYRITGVGKSIVQTTESCEINLKSLNGGYQARINCLVLPQLTTTLPFTGIDIRSFKIPNHINLADPSFHVPSEVDLIIGADYFWEYLIDGKIRLPNGPYLQNTRLGWIVGGTILTEPMRNNQVQCNFVQTSEIGDQLKKFWEIEEIDQNNHVYSQEHQACEKLFLTTTIRDNDGRFHVRIPLKDSIDALGDSYVTARNQFISFEKKLNRNPQYKQMYCAFMNEYLGLGHMTRIENYTKPNYFLPHHGVFREHSCTTRLRVVFNGSQKTTSKKSLNDIQMIGPTLQNDLLSILLRFRQYKYVACADIEKFYRQVRIQDDLKPLQLILWRENPSEPLCVYQLNTVTYGTASAPYLSMRCVRQLGQECTDEEISRIILDDLYVDDLITGDDNKLKLSQNCKRVSDLCMSGCFPLRKWISNSPEIISSVVQCDDINQSKYLSLGENTSSKTLGIGWFNKSDEFHFLSKLTGDMTKVTKRLILSVVSQIYDPLGLLSPIVIVAKSLLQKLWLCRLSWDDEVPHDVKMCWEKFIHSLINLHTVRVPRCVISAQCDSSLTELHVFTDASEIAFGTCAYIRTLDVRGDSTVRLLCSKSRVAPLKTVSIPRLELCAAVLGTKMFAKIIKSLRLQFNKVIFWTDSMIVLGWLRTSPHQLKTFVQNRVAEINEFTSNAMWLHVSGKNNPADLVSRGCTLDELISSDMWWNGPKFLHQKVNEWTQTQSKQTYTEFTLPELKQNSAVCVPLIDTKPDNSLDFHRFSSFIRMQRVYAYVYRFIKNTRCKVKLDRVTGSLSVAELNKSLIILTKQAQIESFRDEYNMLLNELPFKPSRNLSNLNLFLDNNNVIRIGGRLTNSIEFSYDKKHPMLLDSKHYLTQLIFRHEHVILLHAGPQLLLSHIRDSWWPLGGRNLARRTVRECVKCSRFVCKPIQPKMGDLPIERITPAFPFQRCGTDYAGPFYILNRKGRGAKLEKCYLCLFVCFVTRALHLELVTSLSSESYILTLKRFISRRGKPNQIYSDNGRNFVGAAREFTDFLQGSAQSIVDYASNNQIQFSFIPIYAPHFGGLWESGVKSCKHHIARVIGNAHLTYEEFSTVLAQIESVLNSRPMYPLSVDPNDFAPLTPAHFLIGRPLTSPACDDVTSRTTHTLSRYQRVEQLRQQFWRRWSTEYIAELQKRTKWQESTGEIQPNTLVLIKEDNLPPLKWRLGRIVAMFPGKDGICRVASIRTENGVIQRAASKICPLPVPTSENQLMNFTNSADE